MSFSQFLSILKARWKAALLVLVLTVGITTTVSLLLPKKYTAAAAVIVEMNSDPVLGMVLAGGTSPGYMATQVDIITSDRVAQRVVQMLKLTENPQLRKDWLETTAGAGSFDAWIANLLQSQLDVKPSHTSNVINVAYTALDGRFAAVMANAFVDAYMQTTLDLRVAPAREYNSFFDARSKDLRSALETSQAKLSDYQRTHGLLVNDERLDIETQRLNELSSQLVAIQAVSADSTSRSVQARSSADQLQDVINNPVVAGLRADISRQEAKLQEMSSRLGDAHPQVVELKANLNEMNRRIETETRRVSSSVGINNTINKSREAEIRSALESQRIKVLKLKEQRDVSNVLLRDVENAQRAYEAVANRLSQTGLESKNNQTNISMLSRATEPPRPSSPRLLINTIASILVGLALAMAFCLIRELVDRRVRSTQDLTELLGLPVLGALPKPLRSTLSGSPNPMFLPGNVVGRLPSPNR